MENNEQIDLVALAETIVEMRREFYQIKNRLNKKDRRTKKKEINKHIHVYNSTIGLKILENI